jgi:hypothetical protein
MYRGLRYAIVLLTVFFFLSPSSIVAGDIPKMSIDHLMGQLDDRKVLVLDVRGARDWRSSAHKIRGARRAAPGEFAEWVKTLPRKQTLVLYCA